MTKYQRFVCAEALVIVLGWFSLHYGWGLEIKRWWPLLVFLFGLSLGLAPLNGWIMRGRGGKAERKGAE